MTQVHDDGTVTVHLEPAFINQDDPTGDVPGDPDLTLPADLEPTLIDWSALTEIAGGFMAPAADLEPAKCSECRGTGWYVGLNSKEPCSQGCKP